MLKSMTGFGRAEGAAGDKIFLAEVKSLNGKQYDLSLKIPSLLKPFEFDIRNLISEKLSRGSLECSITIKQNGGARPVSINADLARSYYQPLKQLADELNLDTGYLLSAIMKLPDVVSASTETLTTDEWNAFKSILEKAIGDLDKHRMLEGDVLKNDLVLRIDNIQLQQDAILKLEPVRRQKIKEGIEKLLQESVGKENIDGNRMEQELIYYIEKIDISEEQVRLKNHCEYFIEILNSKEESKGKKLSFVLQEIGREINTTGAKAYDSDIQKCVVLMKDELEKAKEQVLNVL
jgi:uncharacterized protein (TIGR00255 family)